MKRAIYRIMIEGKGDMTPLIADRFLSLTVTDAAGDDSDAFRLQMDNRDDKILMPPTGTKMRIYIGYDKALMDKGLFTIDEISEDLWTGDLEVSGKALDTKGPIKGQKTRTWRATTLGAMAATIAREGGYQLTCHPSLSSIKVPHTNQKAESDLNLLTRLCKKHKGIMKIGDGKILIGPKDKPVTASGKPLPVVNIDDPDESKGRVTMQERGTFGAVTVSWFDAGLQANVNMTIKGSKEGPTQTLKGQFLNQDEAVAAATAYLAAQERGKATMSLDRPLTPDIVAPGMVKVSGHRQSANGTWYVESAEHYIGGQGQSRTTLSLTTEHYDSTDGK